MNLQLTNFGRFAAETVDLQNTVAPNGSGKTTIVNAYLFALTGKTLTGFEPRKVGTPDNEPTTVILSGMPGVPSIRRTYTPSQGTTLYVGDDYCTQTDFVRACADRGIDIEFAALCADVNVLTNPALTSDDLRKLLVRADVMDGGEAETLRKNIADLRKRKKVAEQYALSNVTIPARTVEPLNTAERAYVYAYNLAYEITKKPVPEACPTCGTKYDTVTVEQKRTEFAAANRVISEREEEVFRLLAQEASYNAETQAIEDAKRIIAAASKARADVVEYDTRIETLDMMLRGLEANAVRAELPEGVELVTESTSKTGTTKSVCTLTWNGVPLKSVNRAKRIEICVELLARARASKGVEAFPIIVDNAESVQGLEHVSNLIRLSVG